MPTEEELVNKFSPKHIKDELPKSTEVLKEEAEKALQKEPEEPSPTDDPRTQKEYPFELNWKSPNGKVWKGKFVNKILSINDRQSAGFSRAKMGGGMPSDSIDGYTSEINMMVSHMIFSLITVPEWAKDLMELHEMALLQAIYGEVALHEATFFGLTKDKEGS